MKDNTKDILNNLTIVLVLFRSTKDVLKLLNEIKNFRILIVDNGGNKEILLKIKSLNLNIDILGKNKNLGYGKAINLAYQYIKTPYFFILNPDLLITYENIQKLYNTIILDKNCAIAAPITKPDFDFYGTFPEKENIKKNNFQQRISKRLYDADIEGLCCVDVVKGCAMLINSNLFNKVGKFNEKYFLFYEEIDLCKKIKKLNFSIILCNKSFAYHNIGSSSENDFITLFIKSYNIEKSTLIYYNAKKFNLAQIWKLIKYSFRTVTYFLILNFRKSLINFAKFFAILSYIFK